MLPTGANLVPVPSAVLPQRALARQLDAQQVGYRLWDNAFTAIDDWEAAQKLADNWDPGRLHRKLDAFADRYCPILKKIEDRQAISRPSMAT